MARVRGCGGSVLIGTVSATGIREWGLDYTVQVLDGRGFDSACNPNPVLGMIEWKGKFSGPKDGAPLAMFATALLTLKESTTTGQSWSGSALLTGIHPSVSVDGLVEYAYDFEGVGTLTIATT